LRKTVQLEERGKSNSSTKKKKWRLYETDGVVFSHLEKEK